MDSPYLNAICMGFKSSHILMLLFAWVFKWYPLKPMQIQAGLPNNSLKPIQNASTNGARTSQNDANSVKTHAPVHRILTPNAPDAHTAILAPGRPSDKNNVPHAPAQLRLARTHSTLGTKRKRRRNEADLPVTGVGQAGLAPLNIYIYIYIMMKHHRDV